MNPFCLQRYTTGHKESWKTLKESHRNCTTSIVSLTIPKAYGKKCLGLVGSGKNNKIRVVPKVI